MSTESLFFRINRWLRESIMVKLFTIGFLLLLLLIPKAWINSLIEERQSRINEAINEVSDKWSGSQTICGPILVLPFTKATSTLVEVSKNNYQNKIVYTEEEAFFLPEKLLVNGTLLPEHRHRGIFDVIMYSSKFNISGTFARPDIKQLGLTTDQVHWEKAYLVHSISDLRGISDIPSVNINGKTWSSEPLSKESNPELFKRAIATPFVLNNTDSVFRFETTLAIKGNSSLRFYPMGKLTKVQLKGQWNNPKFDGHYLPAQHIITNDSFNATWQVLHFNRPFPQAWIDAPSDIEKTAFGVDLIMPVDQYQKSMRTAKYGILIVLLTFLSLFLMELIVKVNIHPFQYTLIGSALIVYYILLLSLAEHTGFNTAYIVASVTMILMVSLYALSFVPNKKMAALLAVLLIIFYAYIFVITQAQDYSLLLGSVGLLLIIGAIMYVSRKINWYTPNQQPNNEQQ